jgi:hypothetical protein
MPGSQKQDCIEAFAPCAEASAGTAAAARLDGSLVPVLIGGREDNE